MESTAQRNDTATPATETGARVAPAPAVTSDDHYFMTPADGAVPATDLQLASAPPWLGALVVVFLLSLVIGTALRRTWLRHGGPDFPHALDDPGAAHPPVHARSGIRAHLRAAPVRALRRARR